MIGSTLLFVEDPCYPSPCLHDGVCIPCTDEQCQNPTECECQIGWYGEKCEIRKYMKNISTYFLVHV